MRVAIPGPPGESPLIARRFYTKRLADGGGGNWCSRNLDGHFETAPVGLVPTGATPVDNFEFHGDAVTQNLKNDSPPNSRCTVGELESCGSFALAATLL